MRILGRIDRQDEQLIEGWLLVAEDPSQRLAIEILDGDTVVGRCVADRFRADLRDAGIGDGNCAFCYEMPAFFPKHVAAKLQLKLEGSAVFLAPPEHLESEAGPDGAATVSRFGGLWIDRLDWLDVLGAKHRQGEISDRMADDIFHFVRDGYVVLKGAVAPKLIETVNAEIENVWRSPPEGLLIETFEPDGQMRYIAPELKLRQGRTKMLDLYAHSRTVRAAIGAPDAVAFLHAIFDDKPKAFQGLYFWKGSGQAIHKDTAYVKIDSNPMHLAATWLALEDIEEGTGELNYYVGSHRAPDFLFGGKNKWMESAPEEHDQFLESLHEDAGRYRQVKKSFLAKAGDVLVWHADLAHGGAAIKKPGRSRKSLVTHFTRASDEPFYRRNAAHAGIEGPEVAFVSQYGPVLTGR